MRSWRWQFWRCDIGCFRVFVFAFGLYSSALAQAGLVLELDSQGLSIAEQRASQELLDAALAVLPPSFITRLDTTVVVHWQTKMPAQVLGLADPIKPKVALNALFLPLLQDVSAPVPTSEPPRHGSWQRELLATLLHELIHVYDRARLLGPEQRVQLQYCALQNRSERAVGAAQSCMSLGARTLTLSDDPRLLDLAGWPVQAGQRGARSHTNNQVDRSPDSYELSHPREFVAVNMEYFLLDPEYGCRRPALYAYFSEHFDWAPKHVPCSSALPYLNAGSDFAQEPLSSIDSEQIYAVDYLFADANQQWMSRWGHSMLRLVICAPGRPRGPDCRLDLHWHLVLSFRAFVGDVQLSSWDGLTGVYPSRLFVLPLEQVITEYTKVELRSLNSIPLALSRTQIKKLLEQAVQLHWSYDGGYYFFTNNCAVETLKLLRSGTNHPALQTLDTILPNGLRSLLIARNLADARVLDNPDEALRLGYRFDSFRERYQAMFAVVRARLPIPQEEVEDWLALRASSRQQWFTHADLRAQAALMLLEQAALRRQLLLAQDELKRMYLQQDQDTEDLKWQRANQSLVALLQVGSFLSRPAQLVPAGYGIAQPAEWRQLQAQSQAQQAKLYKLSTELEQNIAQLLLPERLAEIEHSKVNLKALAESLRILHQERGGLTL